MNIFEIEAPDGTIYEVEAESLEQAAAAVGGIGAGDAPRPWHQVLRENVFGDNDPTTQNTGEKIGTTLNKAGEALTFGIVGDEASGAAAALIPGGMDYAERRDYEREQERILERNNPGVALGAEVGGALTGALLPLGAAGAGLRTGRLGTRMARSAAAGAAGAGTYGFAEGEGAEDRSEAAQSGAILGGALGGAFPVVGAGIQKAADARVANRFLRGMADDIPTTANQRASGRALYNQIDDAGVQVNPSALDRLRGEIEQYFVENGLDQVPGAMNQSPAANQLLAGMRKASDDLATASQGGLRPGLPLRALQTFRTRAQKTAMDKTKSEIDRSLASGMVQRIDDFFDNLTAPSGPGITAAGEGSDAIMGDVETVRRVLPQAREAWARMRRSELIEDAIEDAETYVSGPVSGARNRIAAILRNKKTRDMFPPEERAALKRAAQGTAGERAVINLGGGLSQTLTPLVGGATAAGFGSGLGPAGAALGAAAGGMVGTGLQRAASEASERIVQRNIDLARMLIASGKAADIPKASPQARAISEALMRRLTASAAQ